MPNQSEGKGYILAATIMIWSFATGMMAICIPLVKITESGVILPLAVILATTVSTITIWNSSSQKTHKIEILTDNIQVIERKVRDAETFYSHEELDSNRNLKQLDSQDIS